MHSAGALKAEISLEPGNLVKIVVSDDAILDCDDVLAINNHKISLVKDEPHRVLIISGQYSTMTREAMQLVATDAFCKNKSAEAMVVHSLAQRITANFFIRVIKPSSIVRVFNSEHDAREWLKEIP